MQGLGGHDKDGVLPLGDGKPLETWEQKVVMT